MLVPFGRITLFSFTTNMSNVSVKMLACVLSEGETLTSIIIRFKAYKLNVKYNYICNRLSILYDLHLKVQLAECSSKHLKTKLHLY